MRRLLVCSFIWLLSTAALHACSCSEAGPTPCKGLSGADLIFVGTVIHVDDPAPADGRLSASGESHYVFRVDENLSGASTSQLDIYSGRGGADCSFHFQLGRRYLVAPSKADDGRLIATICSITSAVEDAQPLLEQLRAMRDHKNVASLYGVLRSTEEPYKSVTNDETGKPLANTILELKSEDHEFDAATDSRGVFTFYGLPKGQYRFAAQLPSNLELAQTIVDDPLPSIKLPANACYEYDLTALPTGSIQGHVFGPDGKLLPYAPLELFRPDRYPFNGYPAEVWMGSQESDTGYFKFNHVAPGDYIIIYNDEDRLAPDWPFHRTFYPGVSDFAHAGRIHVGAGDHLTNIDFRVTGGRSTRPILVRLVTASGKLPDIRYVEARGDDGSSPTEDELSPGVYRIQLFKDARYTLQGKAYCSATNQQEQTQATVVDAADGGPSEVTLTFPGPGCEH